MFRQDHLATCLLSVTTIPVSCVGHYFSALHVALQLHPWASCQALLSHVLFNV